MDVLVVDDSAVVRQPATLAQDEATSVVYGMPGAAAALGAAMEILPLPDIGAALLRHAGAPPHTRDSG